MCSSYMYVLAVVLASSDIGCCDHIVHLRFSGAASCAIMLLSNFRVIVGAGRDLVSLMSVAG
jgi:hypothetical protein